ncbi:O-antigen ligase family protein [Muriicola sp. Z0-33]|uniref:O-antigen ligase family protein n=1 Tax=Muriicola sp. Z0-33 TaxID=2816957 RepID=UPI00223911E5|nr:hypothetical protein [Muriicola sp. Z0-33]MCW5515599.1 hypothetical protein [Muriicola sp. Z0-33]
MVSKVLDYAKRLGYLNSFLLLCFLLNFFSIGFIFGYLLIITILLKKDFVKQNLDFNLLILLIFSIVYALFYSNDPAKGVQYIFIYALMPATLYMWGKQLVQNSKDTAQLFYVLLGFGIIISSASLISVLLNIQEGGFVQGSRSVPFFWTKKLTNATGVAAPFVLNMCIPAILLSSPKRLSLWMKIALAIIFGLTLVCVLRLGSRTQLVIAMFTFLVALVYMVPKHSLKQNVTLLFLLLACIFLVYRNVSFNWDADWLSSFAGRMDNNGTNDVASGGGRTGRWFKSMQYIIEKPLGWDVKEFGYSHNLWFDVLRLGTVISFFLLVFFTIRSMFQIKHVKTIAPADTSFNVITLVYFIAFMLLFMVEPIIDGSFYIFVFFCLFMGIINKYNTSPRT